MLSIQAFTRKNSVLKEIIEYFNLSSQKAMSTAIKILTLMAKSHRSAERRFDAFSVHSLYIQQICNNKQLFFYCSFRKNSKIIAK